MIVELDECPFCNIERKSTAIVTGSHSFAIKDYSPRSKGHCLVIPNRHVSNFFELSDLEKADMWQVLQELQVYLNNVFEPDGWNVRLNIGAAAGQSVGHTHIHLLPRYASQAVGDAESLKGL